VLLQQSPATMKFFEIALVAWVLSTVLLLGMFGVLAIIRGRRE
jgi:hypothetical protein